MRAAERLARLLWWAGCISLSVAGASYALIRIATHDVAYYVNAVERLLDGAQLYRDLIDVNVPTIYGVMVVPIWVARWLGADTLLAYNLFVLAVAVLSTWATYRAASRVLTTFGSLPDTLAGALLVWFLVVPGADFGQREHLAAMLLTPYAVVRVGSASVRDDIGFRTVVGVAAGIGMVLKPHFALIVLGMEGALLLRRGVRDWRPGLESILLLTASGTVALATVVFFPDYHNRILPLALAVYHGFEWPIAAVFFGLGPRKLAILLMLLLVVPISATLERRIGDAILIFTGGALGAYSAYLLQAKGWYYQIIPAIIYSFTAFTLVIAAWARGGPRQPRAVRFIAYAIGGLVFAYFSLHLVRLFYREVSHRDDFARLIETVQDYAQGGPVLFISIAVDYTFPGINYARATYPYRWHHLLPIPALYRDFAPGPKGQPFRVPEEMSATERSFFESFVDDALKSPPRIILVDRRRHSWLGSAPELDLLAYFCQHLRFAELMTGYEWLGKRAYYDVLVPRTSPAVGSGPCAGPGFDTLPNS